MNLIAIFGAGLLVGAALIVIVPEGMMVLFTSLIDEQHLAEITQSTATSATTNSTVVKLMNKRE
jgi:hypothetical protein